MSSTPTIPADFTEKPPCSPFAIPPFPDAQPEAIPVEERVITRIKRPNEQWPEGYTPLPPPGPFNIHKVEVVRHPSQLRVEIESATCSDPTTLADIYGRIAAKVDAVNETLEKENKRLAETLPEGKAYYRLAARYQTAVTDEMKYREEAVQHRTKAVEAIEKGKDSSQHERLAVAAQDKAKAARHIKATLTKSVDDSKAQYKAAFNKGRSEIIERMRTILERQKKEAEKQLAETVIREAAKVEEADAQLRELQLAAMRTTPHIFNS